LGAAACCLAARPVAAEDTARVQHCLVTLADQADLSPHEVGIVDEINVKAGDRLKKGQVVLQLDNRKAQSELDVAKAKYDAAMVKADDTINIRYAEAAAATAKGELARNEKSNRDVPGSVPMAKIEELQLKCIETTLAIEKAKHDLKTAQAEAAAALAEVHAGQVMLELYKITSPIDGEVVEVRAHKGEAVQPAQPVIQIIRRDKLWVEGQVPASEFARSQLDNQPVTVEVVAEVGRRISIPGKIVFCKPMNETGGSYMIRAEIQCERPDNLWPINPGMLADMLIPLHTAQTP